MRLGVAVLPSLYQTLCKIIYMQKISLTLSMIIMICALLFGASKLLNVIDITKRNGNFFKRLFQFSGLFYPEVV